jgi:hypothetical protein
MLKPVGYRANKCRSYQQALDDFDMTELLIKISNHSNSVSEGAGAYEKSFSFASKRAEIN